MKSDFDDLCVWPNSTGWSSIALVTSISTWVSTYICGVLIRIPFEIERISMLKIISYLFYVACLSAEIYLGL